MYGSWTEWLAELKVVLVDRDRRRARGETELLLLSSYRSLQIGLHSGQPAGPQRDIERALRCPVCRMATLKLQEIIPAGEPEREAGIYRCTWCRFDGQVVVLSPAGER